MRIALPLLLWPLMLPAAVAAQDLPRTLRIEIDARGRIYEGQHVRISRDTLIRDLKNGLHDGAYALVVISADHAAQYGQVKEIADLVEHYGPAGINVELLQKR